MEGVICVALVALACTLSGLKTHEARNLRCSSNETGRKNYAMDKAKGLRSFIENGTSWECESKFSISVPVGFQSLGPGVVCRFLSAWKLEWNGNPGTLEPLLLLGARWVNWCDRNLFWWHRGFVNIHVSMYIECGYHFVYIYICTHTLYVHTLYIHIHIHVHIYTYIHIYI